jgi:adenylate cyclase
MEEVNRRLAGILAADVVGYSAKMGVDDANTLTRVRTLRANVIEPLATAHGGRLFKSMGDGFLVEFPSAVQALRCAIAIQSALNAQAEGLRLRIGGIRGRWWRRATTCSATASSSRPGWNRWPRTAAS